MGSTPSLVDPPCLPPPLPPLLSTNSFCVSSTSSSAPPSSCSLPSFPPPPLSRRRMHPCIPPAGPALHRATSPPPRLLRPARRRTSNASPAEHVAAPHPRSRLGWASSSCEIRGCPPPTCAHGRRQRQEESILHIEDAPPAPLCGESKAASRGVLRLECLFDGRETKVYSSRS